MPSSVSGTDNTTENKGTLPLLIYIQGDESQENKKIISDGDLCRQENKTRKKENT